MRWQHPERGLLQPGQFIALAEETGLIVPLGPDGAAARRCATPCSWQREHDGHTGLHIAVNVSGRQLQDPGIVDDVAARAAGQRDRPEHRRPRDHRERPAARATA